MFEYVVLCYFVMLMILERFDDLSRPNQIKLIKLVILVIWNKFQLLIVIFNWVVNYYEWKCKWNGNELHDKLGNISSDVILVTFNYIILVVVWRFGQGFQLHHRKILIWRNLTT